MSKNRECFRLKSVRVLSFLLMAFFVCFLMLGYSVSAEITDVPENRVAELDNNWWNILLMGGDSRNKTAYGLTDSMIILSVNLKENKTKMTSIMRDTWVSYPGTHRHGKINAANVYGGPEMAIATVNECFDADIRDYIMVNMVGLVGIVDQVGGIDIKVTPDEKKWTNHYAKDFIKTFGAYEGETTLNETGDSVHLNGLLALSFCRNRYSGTDYERTQRQRTVLLAVLEKLKQGDLMQLMSVVAAAIDSVETSLDYMETLELANFGINLDAATIEQYRIPADGTFTSGMKDGVWSIRPNFEKNKEALRGFIYGDAQ